MIRATLLPNCCPALLCSVRTGAVRLKPVVVNSEFDDSHFAKPKGTKLKPLPERKAREDRPYLYPRIFPKFGNLFALNTCYVPSRRKG